jgi:hypothetical protein
MTNAAIKARISEAKPKPKQTRRVRTTRLREKDRWLTPELQAEALREAREWGERRGAYCAGLGGSNINA